MIVFLEAPSAFAALPDQVETALAVQIDVDDRHARLELRNARQSFRGAVSGGSERTGQGRDTGRIALG